MSQHVHDYFAVAIRIASRYHRPLLARFREDVLQECHLLAWEAEKRRYIIVKNGAKRKKFGNGRRIGLKAFMRACNAKFYVFRKQYFSF